MHGSGVVLVGEHPHAIAACLPSEFSHRNDKRLTDALVPEPLVDTKFVQKHLCPLVGMRHLDPCHETGGRSLLVRNQRLTQASEKFSGGPPPRNFYDAWVNLWLRTSKERPP